MILQVLLAFLTATDRQKINAEGGSQIYSDSRVCWQFRGGEAKYYGSRSKTQPNGISWIFDWIQIVNWLKLKVLAWKYSRGHSTTRGCAPESQMRDVCERSQTEFLHRQRERKLEERNESLSRAVIFLRNKFEEKEKRVDPTYFQEILVAAVVIALNPEASTTPVSRSRVGPQLPFPLAIVKTSKVAISDPEKADASIQNEPKPKLIAKSAATAAPPELQSRTWPSLWEMAVMTNTWNYIATLVPKQLFVVGYPTSLISTERNMYVVSENPDIWSNLNFQFMCGGSE